MWVITPIDIKWVVVNFEPRPLVLCFQIEDHIYETTQFHCSARNENVTGPSFPSQSFKLPDGQTISVFLKVPGGSHLAFSSVRLTDQLEEATNISLYDDDTNHVCQVEISLVTAESPTDASRPGSYNAEAVDGDLVQLKNTLRNASAAMNRQESTALSPGEDYLPLP